MPASSSYMSGNPLEMPPYQYFPHHEEQRRPNNKRSQSQSTASAPIVHNDPSPTTWDQTQADDFFRYPPGFFDGSIDFTNDHTLLSAGLYLEGMPHNVPDPPAPLPLPSPLGPFAPSTERTTPSTSVSLGSGESTMAQLILDDFPEDILDKASSYPRRFSTDTALPSVEREDAPSASTDLKRQKGDPQDGRAACWTSPLCPNHTKEGSPPDPSTCGGACAPFLFEDIPEAPEDPVMFHAPSDFTSSISLRRDASDAAAPTTSSSADPADVPVKRETSDPRSTGKTTPPAPTSDTPAGQSKSKSKKRVPHNQVERKYRESLNTQLEALKRVVPSLNPSAYSGTADPGFINASRIANGLLPCDAGDIEDLASSNKPSKAVILASATSYIKQVEREKAKLAEENEKLKARIKALQALVKCDDCSLMRYVMDLKIQPGARAPANA